MKLSEAIKLGAMLKPQGFEGTGHPNGTTTCALGAALNAISSNGCVYGIWPWVNKIKLCPVCEKEPPYAVIPHLNNIHRWTRERIADWVATIEPVEVEPQVEVKQEEGVKV